jgi:hypothetical protein
MITGPIRRPAAISPRQTSTSASRLPKSRTYVPVVRTSG